MSTIIYLYGKGETLSDGRKAFCYFKCEIPDTENTFMNGFMPSVLHSYMMYAKDIGLTVSDVIYECVQDNCESQYEKDVNTQLTYSLWPLVYIDNSEIFTEGKRVGVAVWEMRDENMEYKHSIVLNINHAFYYKERHREIPEVPGLKEATKRANPEPNPNNFVQSDSSWYLELTLPDKGDAENKASTYSIVKHYNEYVVLDTMRDMNNKVKDMLRYHGLKEATGAALMAVIDRKYAYETLMPAWSPSWGEEPAWYDSKRKDLNNYNISASLFTLDTRKDPDSPCTELALFATAGNIKGKIKSGHAETRLLLTVDALNHTRREALWFSNVSEYYGYEKLPDILKILNFYKDKYLVLVSSLKPCYMCVGETDATSDGFIKKIDDMWVDMWACYPGTSINKTIKTVSYFDIDRPIVYPSDILVTIYEDGEQVFQWSLELTKWVQWSAVCNSIDDYSLTFTDPIGPRIVEPAGECLKTGYAYTRYKNSAYLLLTNGSDYKRELEYQTHGYTTDTTDERL